MNEQKNTPQLPKVNSEEENVKFKYERIICVGEFISIPFIPFFLISLGFGLIVFYIGFLIGMG